MMLCIPSDENAHPHPEIVEKLPRGCAFNIYGAWYLWRIQRWYQFVGLCYNTSILFKIGVGRMR